MTEFRMPSLGADMEAGFLREWRVKPGDHVKRGDIIAEVETQKGLIEIEVFDEGIVGELLVRIDETVPVGKLMTHILSQEEKSSLKAEGPVEEKPMEEELERKEKEVHLVEEKRPEIPEMPHIRASPLAREIAKEKGIDLSKIKGTGPEGAITRKDVEIAVAESIAPIAAPQKTPTENIRMAVAAAMSKSNREIPHYYLQTKVNMHAALKWLEKANQQRSVKDRLLPAVLLIKAVAKALETVPAMNAWWENGLQLKQDIHIGFVVSLRTGGIIVPAIHDAGKKSLDELMKALTDIIKRARTMKLRSSELADSTITITNLGEGAVETLFGVIYPPQVAIIGFGGITDQPWAENGMLGIMPVLSISLSADHRATDGNTGNLFLTAVKNFLQQPEQL